MEIDSSTRLSGSPVPSLTGWCSTIWCPITKMGGLPFFSILYLPFKPVGGWLCAITKSYYRHQNYQNGGIDMHSAFTLDATFVSSGQIFFGAQCVANIHCEHRKSSTVCSKKISSFGTKWQSKCFETSNWTGQVSRRLCVAIC